MCRIFSPSTIKKKQEDGKGTSVYTVAARTSVFNQQKKKNLGIYFIILKLNMVTLTLLCIKPHHTTFSLIFFPITVDPLMLYSIHKAHYMAVASADWQWRRFFKRIWILIWTGSTNRDRYYIQLCIVSVWFVSFIHFLCSTLIHENLSQELVLD